jgi:hypothetical protein
MAKEKEEKQVVVKIMFPGLTHGGKLYDFGDIEETPDKWLIDAAKNKTRLFHKDSNKELRIAKFININDDYEQLDVDDDEDDDVAAPRRPAYKMIVMDPDLEDLMNRELRTIANKMGLKAEVSKNFGKDKLQKFITLMRRI